jgi:hypothetical protein
VISEACQRRLASRHLVRSLLEIGPMELGERPLEFHNDEDNDVTKNHVTSSSTRLCPPREFGSFGSITSKDWFRGILGEENKDSFWWKEGVIISKRQNNSQLCDVLFRNAEVRTLHRDSLHTLSNEARAVVPRREVNALLRLSRVIHTSKSKMKWTNRLLQEHCELRDLRDHLDVSVSRTYISERVRKGKFEFDMRIELNGPAVDVNKTNAHVILSRRVVQDEQRIPWAWTSLHAEIPMTRLDLDDRNLVNEVADRVLFLYDDMSVFVTESTVFMLRGQNDVEAVQQELCRRDEVRRDRFDIVSRQEIERCKNEAELARCVHNWRHRCFKFDVEVRQHELYLLEIERASQERSRMCYEETRCVALRSYLTLSKAREKEIREKFKTFVQDIEGTTSKEDTMEEEELSTARENLRQMFFEVVNLPLSDVEVVSALRSIEDIQRDMYDGEEDKRVYFEAFLMYYTLSDLHNIEEDVSFSRRILRNKLALKQRWRGAQIYAKDLEEKAKIKMKENMSEARRKLSHLKSNIIQEGAKTRERLLSSIRDQYENRKKSLNKQNDEVQARIEAELAVIRKETREELDDEDEEKSNELKELIVQRKVMETRFDMEDEAFYDVKTQGTIKAQLKAPLRAMHKRKKMKALSEMDEKIEAQKQLDEKQKQKLGRQKIAKIRWQKAQEAKEAKKAQDKAALFAKIQALKTKHEQTAKKKKEQLEKKKASDEVGDTK